MKSDSMPSLNIAPPEGIRLSITSSCPSSITPMPMDALECLLMNGSRTAKISRLSSRAMGDGDLALPPQNSDIKRVMLKMDDIQPVDPAAVETIRPLED